MVEWPPLPANEEILAALAGAKRETMFWIDNYERFRREYPDLWVTVRNGEVIDTDTDYERLRARLDAAGLERPEVWTRFVPRKPLDLIL
jgi:hypothetical protein